jgi:hypothetical protein
MNQVELSCGPVVRTIAVLAEHSFIEEVERTCVPDPWGVELAPKASFFGVLGTSFFTVFDALGWTSSQSLTKTVLRTTRAALQVLRDVLLHPTEENVASVSGLLSLGFDERWQKKCIWVNRLLGEEDILPPFDKALRIVAPGIVHSITAMPIPWDALRDILMKGAVDPVRKEVFQRWIDELKIWGSHLSPLLMLSLCESATIRVFGDENPGKVAEGAFCLVFELYKLSLTWLAEVDGSFAINRFAFFGAKIPIQFPREALIEAYEVPWSRDSMVIISPAPLYLGLWVYKMDTFRSLIPYVRAEVCDKRGRFLTTERLICSCSALSWDGPGATTARDRRLLYNIGTLCSDLVRQQCTPTLDLSDLFVTTRLEICTLRPIGMGWPFLCLPAIESFIHEMCQRDVERVREVLDRSGFWDTQTVKMYRELMSRYSFKGTDEDVKRELRVFDLDIQQLPVVSAWVRELRTHVDAACRTLQEKEGSEAVRPESCIRAVLRLQNEGGFVAVLPSNLYDRIVTWMRRYRG